jgi:hypothetical protein
MSPVLSGGIEQNTHNWSQADYPLHKYADLVAAASEARHSVGWSVDEVRNDLGIAHPILATDPLASVYDCRPWEPWTSGVAATRFLSELQAISAQLSAELTSVA